MPKILDFENKRSYFKLRQENRRSYGRIPITVRRSNIFADSYHAIMSRTPDELKVILEVHFNLLEEAIDLVHRRRRYGCWRRLKRVVQSSFEGDF
jgi:hypothetical protein